MMKHTQTIVAKCCGRAFSAVASTPVATSVKQSWEEIPGFLLGVIFVGGYTINFGRKLCIRMVHANKVDRMFEEQDKRGADLLARMRRFQTYQKEMLQLSKLEADRERRS